MQRQLTLLVGIVVLTAGLLIYTFASGSEPLLGLDLQGGASVVLEPTTDVSGDRLDQAIEIIRDRVDGLGVAEPDISRQGDTILVELPGVDDQERALELVGQTAELRFRPVLGVLPPSAPLDVSASGDDTTTSTGDDSTTTAAADGEEPTTTGGVDTTTTRSRRLARQATTTVAEEEATTTTVADDGTEGTVPPAPELVATSGDTGEPDPTAALGTRDRCLADFADRAAEGRAGTESGIAPVDPETGLTPSEADLPCDQVTLPQVDADGNVVLVYQLGPTAFTGTVISDADARIVNGEWVVEADLRGGDAGRGLFNEMAAACFGSEPTCPNRALAFALDGVVVTAPEFQAPEFEGVVVISGGFDEGRAKDTALVLRYGALPVELVPQTSQVVSATIGEDALRAGVIAGVLGLALVALFMVVYYRLLGAIAVLSLLLAIGLIWSVIAWLGETQGLALTLAGVTGLIVSIGIALDSNIVYFEHLKEDVRDGRTVRSAADRSFPSAFSTIVKADVASLIGAGLLYLLTVGSVKGFALYLGLATIIDLVVTYFFLGPAVRLVSRHRSFTEHPQWYGIPVTQQEVRS